MEGLNDADEGKYWIDVVRPIVNRDSVSESLKQSFNRDRNSFGLHQDWFSYVASFSGRNDIANQWNRYARNGTGCAITVDYKCLFSEAGIQYSLARMAYDRHDQSCKVDDTLKKAIDLRRELGIPCKHGKYWFEVFMSLYVCGLRFKEPAFAEEEEWRVQVFEPERTTGTFDETKQRYYSAIPINYNVISGVILGPECQETNDDVRSLLTSHGYSNATVTRSRREDWI